MLSRTPNPEPRTPNPEPRTPNPESRIPNPESRIPKPESRTPNPESRIPNPESRIPSPESRVPSPESRVPSPESFKRQYHFPLRRRHRQHREPVAAAGQREVAQLRQRLDLVKRDHALQLALEAHVHQRPARIAAVAAGVEVFALRIELGRIRIRRAGNRGQPGHARHRATGVIDQHAVALAHLAAEIARLVVAHTVPRLDLDALQVDYREHVRFGFHQPMVHGCSEGVQAISPLSVAMQSSGTSQSSAGSSSTCWKA